MNYIKLLSVAFTSTVLIGCGSGGDSTGGTNDACGESNNTSFNCTTMLNNVVDIVVQPVMDDVVSKLNSQEGTLSEYCNAIGDASKKTAAQADWLDTMASAQQLAVMQFGPLKSEDTFKQLYSWPSYGEELFDLEIVDYDNAENQSTYAISSSASRKGLIALEYVLFTDDGYMAPEDEDTPQSIITWQSGKTASEKQQARCDYALLAIDDLLTQAEALQGEWNAYSIVDDYSSLQAAANAISDALFYIDKQTKDAKLIAALPQETNGTFNAESLESQYANASKTHIKNNLLAAKALLEGDTGLGINDYLAAKGQSTLGDEMVAALDVAIANVDAISGNLQSAVSNASDVSECINATSYATGDSDIVKTCALQKNLKAFTDLLKEDFVLALSFSKPSDASGDND